MFGHVALLMSSMQCVESYMLTLKDFVINIRLDKNGQLRKKIKDVTYTNER